MKSCPRCGKTYPDSETFCEVDGTALTSNAAGRRTTVMTDDPASGDLGGIECPVCGGQAQPGEVICNFCGTRLVPPTGETAATTASGSAGQTRASPEAFVPASERAPIGSSGRGASQPLGGAAETYEEPSASRSVLGILGFALAAAIALGGGAWLAIYLSNRHATAPVSQASASPAAVSSPTVTLAKTISIQTTGDMAGVMQRDPKSLAKVFDDNTAGLAGVYHDALSSSPGLSDGMIVRLHVNPDGSVTDGSVRISTSANPSLDAAVVKASSGWKFAPASGTGVDADYPIIFASNPADTDTIESDLSAKVASLGPSSTPEYALSPALPSPAEAVASPSPMATPPEAASLPPVETAPVAPRPVRHKPAVHRPPLIERVNDALRSDRKLRRVQAYTSGGDVTLSGRVFDDNDRMVAEQTVRGVAGVHAVNNNLATDTAEWERAANTITQQLQSAGLTGVTVKVIGKRAYLSGEVKTELDRERAVSVTQAAAPVVVGTNLIRVVPPGLF